MNEKEWERGRKIIGSEVRQKRQRGREDMPEREQIYVDSGEERQSCGVSSDTSFNENRRPQMSSMLRNRNGGAINRIERILQLRPETRIREMEILAVSPPLPWMPIRNSGARWSPRWGPDHPADYPYLLHVRGSS